MKQQYHVFDALKFIIAFLVIAIHCNVQEYSQLFRKVCDLAVPLFFMMSGYLLLKKVNRGGYAKCYIIKLSKLYLLWSIIYLPLAIKGYYEWNLSLPVAIYGYVRDFFFVGQHYMSWQLWYLLALIYGVCMIKLFQKMKISIEGCAIIGILLTFIGLLMNVIHDASLQNNIVNSIVSGYFELFRTVRNGIFNGFLFIVLGMLLCKHLEILKRIPKYVTIMILLLSIGLYLYDIPFALHLLSFTLLYYILLVRMPEASYYVWLRNMSTLIYFSHMLFVALIKYTFTSVTLFGEEWLYASIMSFIFSILILKMTTLNQWEFLNKLLGK